MAARKKIRSPTDFIRQLTSEGSNGTVISIDPETGEILGRGYVGGESLKAVDTFIEKHAQWNLYWSPNPLKEALNKKATKEDIEAMRWVHLDFDDDISDECLERLRRYRLPPTMIVASGGGFNVYWQLAEPVHANGNLAALEEANRRVIIDLGAQIGTQNLDRILRLPFTTNYPNKAKLARGRVAVPARLIEYHPERTYTLAQFAPLTDAENQAWSRREPGNQKKEDRSAELWNKVGADVKAGLSDADIHSKYKDHPHVLDQQKRWRHRAVQRCIDGHREPSGPAIVLRSALDLVMNPVLARWLCKPYLEHDVIAVLWGDKDTFKTFLALDWSFHIALGRAWHGETRKLEAQHVVFVSAEGRGLAKRMRAWVKHHYPKESHEAVLRRMKFHAIEMPINLSNPERMKALVAAIDALGVVPVLIVIDTLTRNSTGVEESNTAMSDFLNAVNAELRVRYHCTVLLVHHTGHSAKDHARGPYSLEANTEASFEAHREDRFNITLRTERLKDSEAPVPLALEARIVEGVGLDADGAPESSLILVGGIALRVIPTGELLRPVWDLLSESTTTSYSKKDLYDAVRKVIPNNRIFQTLKSLRKAGWLECHGDRWEFLK